MPLGEIVCHLSTQVNDSDISAYITVFDSRRDKRRRFINFLVYALVYLSIAINLVTLSTLSPWSVFVYTVVVQRQVEGVEMCAQGKPSAHGNYKAGRTRE